MTIQASKLQAALEAKDEADSSLDEVSNKLAAIGMVAATCINRLVAGVAVGAKVADDLQQSVANIPTIRPGKRSR